MNQSICPMKNRSIMEKTMKFKMESAAIIIMAIVLFITACDVTGKSHWSLSPVQVFTPNNPIHHECVCEKNGQFSAGDKETYAADSVSFEMAYVPACAYFPHGWDEYDGQATVKYSFWIGETEVTYELWKKVYDWATTDAGGGALYMFANAGAQGGAWSNPTTDQHPVTAVNWRDAIVWCNALTEWYNAQNGTTYQCAYTYSGAVIRDSRDTNSNACDNAVKDPAAKGFRLPASAEWELAARRRNDATNSVSGYADPYFTKSDSASGATANCDDLIATDLVAWFDFNSDDSTHEVKKKIPNALGIYDMSGNVSEWCEDKQDYTSDNYRVNLGCSWRSWQSPYMGIGELNFDSPDSAYFSIGFRIARTR